MRRAMRHGKHLGLTEPFLHTLVAVLDREMGDAYPGAPDEPRDDREDDSRRREPLRRGADRRPARLEKRRSRRSSAPEQACLSGDAAFRLYDTFGVPFDFIEDTAATQGVTVDRGGLRARDGGPARQGAREERVRRRKRRRRSSLVVPTHRALKAVGDQFEGYGSDPRRRASRSSACSTRSGSRSTRLAGRTVRLRRARANAVLPRSRRPGLGRRPHLQRGDRRVGDRGRARPHPRRACRAHTTCA